MSEVLGELARRYTTDDSREYLRTHAPRYARLLPIVARIVEEARRRHPGEGVRILDAGASYEAEAIRALHPDVTLDSLGFFDGRFPPREHEQHVEFDLNDAEFEERWPALADYDLVLLLEVIEHLYTAPLHLLRLLRRSLRPGGYLLLQTPNAARLKSRLELLLGRNPIEPLRESRRSPGHIREYTVEELLALGRQAGLEVSDWFAANYFDTGSRKNAVYVAFGRFVPPRLRAGITLWLRRPSQ